MRSQTLFVAAAAWLSCASSAMATPIYLRAGQCILVGTQEVCSLTNDQSTAISATTTQLIHKCVYGKHPGAELPDLKSYALFQTMVSSNGVKVETLIRNYGTTDAEKNTCQREADRLNEAKK